MQSTRATIPYIAGVSERIKKVYAQFGISTSFRPCDKLRNSLVRVKDITPRAKRSHVVYGIVAVRNQTVRKRDQTSIEESCTTSTRKLTTWQFIPTYTHLVTQSTRRKWSTWTVSRTGFAGGSGRRCMNGLSDRH